MTRANVRDFMRHNSRQLRFLIGAQHHAAIHIEESAGERKGIHHIGIDHLDREGHLRVRIANQVLPDAIHIFRHHRVGDELRNAVHFLRQLLAQRNLMLHRIHVQPMPDLAVADGVDVRLAAAFHARLVQAHPRRHVSLLRRLRIGSSYRPCCCGCWSRAETAAAAAAVVAVATVAGRMQPDKRSAAVSKWPRYLLPMDSFTTSGEP